MFCIPHEKMYKKATSVFEHTKVNNPINHDLVKLAFKKKPDNAHKGTAGSLLICAGSPGLTGAGCLCADSALRCGCGLVTLCCSEELNTIFEIKLTEAMTMPVSSEKGVITFNAFDAIFKKLKTCNALLYGPGLSRNDSIGDLLFELLKTSEKPMVIDADGLYALSKNVSVLSKVKAPVIITPHIGEFAYLTGYTKEYILNNLHKTANEFAKKYSVTVVLKSHKTIVTDGTEIFENVLGSPAMAVGGSGDVLAGIIASFLTQGNPPLLSSLAGVYLHSLAADMATIEMGEMSMLPRDIIRYISYASKLTAQQE